MGVFVVAFACTVGCTTVVVPLSASDSALTHENQGLLVGKIHLTRNGKAPSEGLTWPRVMKWWVVEEGNGERFLITHLPVDGPFALRLPAGSYRVADITFEGTRGIWHTVLPTTFHIRAQACTTLGVLDLQMQTGFFTGWITRQVSHEEEITHEAIERAFGEEGCPTMVAPLESPVQSLVKHNFHTRDAGRF